MQTKRLSRRSLLKSALVGSAGIALAACQPKIVTQTVVVEKPVEKVVEKEVTKVVEKEKVVKETVVVEKQAATPAPQEITLIVQHPHPAYEKFGETTADPGFQDKHPGVKVKREFTAGYVKEFYPKLMTMHVGGVSWDVAELPSWAGMEYVLYLKGVLKELTPFLERDKFDMKVFFPVAAKGASFRGMATAMLPILVDPGQGALMYNMTLLEKAGVPEPTPEWRYDVEFREALDKIKKTFGEEVWTWLPHVTGTFGYQSVFDAWNTTIFDENGKELLLESEKNVACMKFFYDLFESKVVPRFGTLPTGADQMYIAGQMVFETTFAPVVPWRVKAVEGKFDARGTLMPKGPAPDGKNGGSANPHYMGVGNDSKNPELGWEYLKWFTGPEMADPLWDAGLVPARMDTWAKRAPQDPQPIWSLSEKLLMTVDLAAVPWNFRGGEVEDALKNGMDKVWLGQVGLQDGIAATAAKIKEVMDMPMP